MKPKREGYRYVWDAASGKYKLGVETDCSRIYRIPETVELFQMGSGSIMSTAGR